MRLCSRTPRCVQTQRAGVVTKASQRDVCALLSARSVPAQRMCHRAAERVKGHCAGSHAALTLTSVRCAGCALRRTQEHRWCAPTTITTRAACMLPSPLQQEWICPLLSASRPPHGGVRRVHDGVISHSACGAGMLASGLAAAVLLSVSPAQAGVFDSAHPAIFVPAHCACPRPDRMRTQPCGQLTDHDRVGITACTPCRQRRGRRQGRGGQREGGGQGRGRCGQGHGAGHQD